MKLNSKIVKVLIIGFLVVLILFVLSFVSYKPVVAPEAEVETTACVIGGCSGQICSDEAVITDCAWREEYSCYANAECERQQSGQCGWTQTDELMQCLASTR